MRQIYGYPAQKVLGIAAAILAIIIILPLGVIWGLNTLFSLSIAYNSSTWLAVILVSMATGGSRYGGK